MTERLPLGPIRHARTVGPSERHLLDQLRAWRPWLSGPEHAADREKLRDLARNVDRARELVESGDDRAPTPYSYAMTRRVFADELARHTPPPRHDVDPDDDLPELSIELDAD